MAKKPKSKSTKKSTTSKKAQKTPKMSSETAQLAAWLQASDLEVDAMGSNLLAARLPTRQFEVPLVAQVTQGNIVYFDLYPFRFVPVDVGTVDWPFLVQLASDTQLVKICIDLETGEGGAAPIFYSVQLPFESLNPALVAGVIGLLTQFSEERHDVIRRATHLDEQAVTQKKQKKPSSRKSAR